jgi:hypothetical protein
MATWLAVGESKKKAFDHHVIIILVFITTESQRKGTNKRKVVDGIILMKLRESSKESKDNQRIKGRVMAV